MPNTAVFKPILFITGLTLASTLVCPSLLASPPVTQAVQPSSPLTTAIDPPVKLGPAVQLAQTITPAADGTGTVINQSDNQFTIEGGTTAGANLFHSFEQLNLNADQVANFLTQPEIQNILGRVTGGDPSTINGLLQVTGAQANLFLMNPAGIIFGPDAQISVPGSFTATSANRIELDDYWFNAMGSNDYANLVGHPSGFAFATDPAGAVVNAGNVTVPQGESVTLLGGTVLNLGTISAPGGNITIAAVPGERLVRISQEGSLISLDLPMALPNSGTEGEVQPVSVTQLLAPLSGVEENQALTWVVEGDVVRLASSGTALPTQPGAATMAGTLNTASSGSGGTINVLGERVSLLGSTLDASGSEDGGQVRIGGDYQGQGLIPTAEQTYVGPDATIHADAGASGDGGQVIIWADGTTRFYGTVTARGGISAGNGGFVEVSGRDNLVYRGQVAANAPNGQPGTLLLDPENIVITPGNGGSRFDGVVGANDPEPTTISEAQLEDASLANVNVRLEATNDIRIEGLQADPGNPNGNNDQVNDQILRFASGSGSIDFIADADNDGNGSFSIYNRQQIEQVGSSLADNNDVGIIQTNGRDLTISGASIIVSGIETRGGDVTLTSSTGDVIVRFIDTSLNNELSPAAAGNVRINANRLFRATGVIFGSNVNSQGPTVSIQSAGSFDQNEDEATSGFFGGEILITHGGTAGFVTGARADESPTDEKQQLFELKLVPDFSFLESQSGSRGAILSRNTNGVRRSVYLDRELTTSGLGGTIKISFEEIRFPEETGFSEEIGSLEVCEPARPNDDCETAEVATTPDRQDEVLDVSEVMPEAMP